MNPNRRFRIVCLAAALGVVAVTGVAHAAGRAERVSLNPQPLPPRDAYVSQRIGPPNPGGPVSLNPQPLPPKEINSSQRIGPPNPGGPVSLNPQPLPPRQVYRVR